MVNFQGSGLGRGMVLKHRFYSTFSSDMPTRVSDKSDDAVRRLGVAIHSDAAQHRVASPMFWALSFSKFQMLD